MALMATPGSKRSSPDAKTPAPSSSKKARETATTPNPIASEVSRQLFQDPAALQARSAYDNHQPVPAQSQPAGSGMRTSQSSLPDGHWNSSEAKASKVTKAKAKAKYAKASGNKDPAALQARSAYDNHQPVTVKSEPAGSSDTRSMLARVRRDLGGSNSRDLSSLVGQVTAILPQFSDDACCEALVQCDEDVGRAVELLLSRPVSAKKAAKDKKPVTGPNGGTANAGSSGSAVQDKGAGRLPLSRDATAGKEVSSRNLDHLVAKVTTLLPQSDEDTVRNALVQTREDSSLVDQFQQQWS